MTAVLANLDYCFLPEFLLVFSGLSVGQFKLAGVKRVYLLFAVVP
jgi:hypothetical protein